MSVEPSRDVERPDIAMQDITYFIGHIFRSRLANSSA
jgi:hypothetical protein